MKLTDEEIGERGLEVCIDGITKKIVKDGEIYIVYRFADKDAAAERLQKPMTLALSDGTKK